MEVKVRAALRAERQRRTHGKEHRVNVLEDRVGHSRVTQGVFCLGCGIVPCSKNTAPTFRGVRPRELDLFAATRSKVEHPLVGRPCRNVKWLTFLVLNEEEVAFRLLGLTDAVEPT